MQFLTTIALLASATFTLAAPVVEERQLPLCTSGTPQCCAVNVLDLADLQCANPPTTPTDTADFTSICAAIGQEAQCCLLPILEQGLICTAPI